MSVKPFRPQFMKIGVLTAALQAHPAKLPLSLQDHSYPVRFRNIWIRELAD